MGLERDSYNFALRIVKGEYFRAMKPPSGRILEDRVYITADAPRSLGTWSIPDLLGLRRVNLPLQGITLTETHVFEVKRWSDLNLSSVYEAAAQTRAANFGSVFAYSEGAEYKSTHHSEVEGACREFGLGLVYFWGNEISSHRIELKPIKRDADPILVERMLEVVLSSSDANDVASWSHQSLGSF